MWLPADFFLTVIHQNVRFDHPPKWCWSSRGTPDRLFGHRELLMVLFAMHRCGNFWQGSLPCTLAAFYSFRSCGILSGSESRLFHQGYRASPSHAALIPCRPPASCALVSIAKDRMWYRSDKNCLYGVRGFPMIFNFSVVTQQTIGVLAWPLLGGLACDIAAYALVVRRRNLADALLPDIVCALQATATQGPTTAHGRAWCW
jgi:hypothetical protein